MFLALPWLNVHAAYLVVWINCSSSHLLLGKSQLSPGGKFPHPSSSPPPSLRNLALNFCFAASGLFLSHQVLSSDLAHFVVCGQITD